LDEERTLGSDVARRLRLDAPESAVLLAPLTTSLAIEVLLHLAQGGLLALPQLPEHLPILEFVHGGRNNKPAGHRLEAPTGIEPVVGSPKRSHA
jgi:hypothetical protein